ncbi:hypothetical protein ACX80E_01560 [Arthrobacter sp. TMN-49]
MIASSDHFAFGIRQFDSLSIVHNAVITTPVLCISGEGPGHDQIAVAGNNVFFVADSSEFENLSVNDYRDVLVLDPNHAVVNRILPIVTEDRNRAIHWYFQVDLQTALEQLATLNLPSRLKLIQINFLPKAIVLSTGHHGGLTLDNDSLRAGVQAGILAATAGQPRHVASRHQDYIQELQQKLFAALSLISDMENANTLASDKGAVPTETDTHDNELILLKSKYDALERKYDSLSGSKLGKLTLKLWSKNRKQMQA